jgi:deoxyribonuclease (pyrimidine dimer)
MTRINLVPPEELMDQHLFAEFREIKMIPKSLRRSLLASEKRDEDLYDFWKRIPKEYTLNKGHVSFFYDKGAYLADRYNVLRHELRRRGYKFDENALMDPKCVFASLDHNFNNHYIPSEHALALVRARIAERISQRPNWYRYNGKLIGETDNG